MTGIAIIGGKNNVGVVGDYFPLTAPAGVF